MLRPFAAGELDGVPVPLVAGSAPNDVAAGGLADMRGHDPITVEGDHEVYPTGIVGARAGPIGFGRSGAGRTGS